MASVRRDPIDPAAWGIQTTYRNFRDEPRVAPFSTVASILEVMDASVSGPPEPRVRVVTAGALPDIPDAHTLTLEDGSSTPLDGGWPDDVPLGYHDVTHHDGRRTRMIVTPRSCPVPAEPLWGWAIQLYSIRSAASWGIGDLADLRKLAATSRRRGAGMVMLNPLHAAEPGEPQQPSPYYPSSRRFRNPLYLRIEDVPGAQQLGAELAPLARAGRELLADRVIDRDRVFRLKRDALDHLWGAFPKDEAAFGAYRAEQGSALWGYATFCALVEQHGHPWSQWPAELRNPGSAAVAAFADRHADRVSYHAWLQWLLDEQLRQAAAANNLINDLAVGSDPDGADTWLGQDVYARGIAVGAPPDDFNTLGQDWGFPPFDPWRLRAAGYAPFIETLRAAFRHSAGIRIDHVFGLFRLFWIPVGFSPTDGVYVRCPAPELLDIVALESERAGAFVVGEDLGTTEPGVREELGARGLLSYRVLWFEDSPPSEYPWQSVGTVATHDLPTIAGLWTGADERLQQRLGLQPNHASLEAARERLLRFTGVEPTAEVADVIQRTYAALANAPSALVAASLEDALVVEERPNLPGTTGEKWPDWSLALPATLEELERAPLAQEIASLLSRA
jgi:4-alpha-glucanotransferase